MKKIKILFVMLFLLGFGLTSVFASDVFVGKGRAIIIDGKKQTALKLAKNMALKKAVFSAMKSLVKKGSKEQQTLNFKKAELLKNDFDFIVEKKIVSEDVEGKFVSIEIEIQVDIKKVSRLLKQEGVIFLKTQKQKKIDFPSIMVVVVEEMSGSINKFPFSSRLITQELLQKKFDVVDETLIKKSIKHDQAVQGVLKGDAKAAQAVALQYGAGIVITGRSIAQAAAMKSGGMQTYSANVVLEAIHVDTGRVIASSSKDSSYPHIDSVTGSKKAIEIATKKAVTEIVEKMEQNFKTSHDYILVSISDINFKQLAILKRILKRDFKDIAEIKQKSFGGGVAKLDFKIDSSPEQLVEDIVMKDFGSFMIDVLSYSSRKIDLILKMKETK